MPSKADIAIAALHPFLIILDQGLEIGDRKASTYLQNECKGKREPWLRSHLIRVHTLIAIEEYNEITDAEIETPENPIMSALHCKFGSYQIKVQKMGENGQLRPTPTLSSQQFYEQTLMYDFVESSPDAALENLIILWHSDDDGSYNGKLTLFKPTRGGKSQSDLEWEWRSDVIYTHELQTSLTEPGALAEIEPKLPFEQEQKTKKKASSPDDE